MQIQTISTHEIDAGSFAYPMPIIKVNNLTTGDALKVIANGHGTLMSGDALRINACSKITTHTVSKYFSNTGHTLLQHVEIDNNFTLYIRKN